jgi:hypothetical protein
MSRDFLFDPLNIRVELQDDQNSTANKRFSRWLLSSLAFSQFAPNFSSELHEQDISKTAKSQSGKFGVWITFMALKFDKTSKNVI